MLDRRSIPNTGPDSFEPAATGISTPLAGCVRSARRRAGFSLVELFIATGAMVMVIFFTLATFTLQHQTYVVVDAVSETQQNTRSIANLIERDLRNAGFMVSPLAAACGVDSTLAPDVLFISDADAIRPVDQLPSSLRGSELGALTSTAAPTSTGSATMTLSSLSPSTGAAVVIDGEATYNGNSDFLVNGGAILIDVTNTGRGVACGVVTSVTPPNTVVVNFTNVLAVGAALPPDLRLVPAISYQVLTPGGGAPDRLVRNGVLLAKDVEDLQVAWFYDVNENGEVDANEYQGGSGTVYDNSLVDGSTLREVRVSLVVRTSGVDPRHPTSGSVGQVLENRTANIPGEDGRRRRLHSSTVRLRNVSS